MNTNITREHLFTRHGAGWAAWTLILALALLAPAAWGANTIYNCDASGSHPAAPTDGAGTWDATSAYWTNTAADVAPRLTFYP